MGNGKFVMSILRFIFFFLDSVVFWAVEQFYKIFLDISTSTIFNRDIIMSFGEKVQTILGIFMLFKVTFSIITYVANPDEMDKDSKGLSSLLKNIIISLVLLVTVPYVFQMATDIQIIVLKDNIIGNFFIGEGSSSGGKTFEKEDFEYAGRKMSFTIFTAFMRPNEDLVGSACDDMIDFASSSYNTLKLDGGCQGAIAGAGEGAGELATEYAQAFASLNINRLTTWDFASTIVGEDTANEEYLFSYKFGLSTAAGLIVAFLLLTYCFDIAVRSVKLGFLEMISPIPIISYIDPKQGKDGIFNKWVKQCTSTYLSLFVRLIVIFFAVYLISMVNGKIYSLVTGEPKSGALIYVFIIIGILMFAKQLPKLLEDIIPGLKLEGSMGLNSLKSGLGAIGAVGAGMIGGAVAGAASGGFFGGVKGLVGGTFGGVGRAGIGLATGKTDMMKKQAAANMNRFQRNLNGVGVSHMATARFNNMMGIPGMVTTREKNIEAYKKINEYNNSIKEAAKKEFNKSTSYQSAQAALDAARQTGNAASIQQAYQNLQQAEDTFVKNHINDVFNGRANNPEIEIMKKQLDNAMKINNVGFEYNGRNLDTVTDYDHLKPLKDQITAETNRLEAANAELGAQRVKAASNMAKK